MKLVHAVLIGLCTAASFKPVFIASAEQDTRLAALSKISSKKSKSFPVNLLTGKTWQVLEVNDLSNCHNTHYLRGANNNTGANYDPLRFTFYDNGKGKHTDTKGRNYNISWRVSETDFQNMEITVHGYSGKVVYIWNLVDITEDRLIETTALQTIDHVLPVDILVSATFVPVNAKPSVTLTDRTPLLTGKTWIVEKVFNNADCTNTHYGIGAADNTGAAYELLKLEFQADGTGTHTDTRGESYAISWKFTSEDQRNLQISIDGTGVVYNWNQVEIRNGEMYSTCALNREQNDVLVSAKWISEIAEEDCETDFVTRNN